MDISIADYRAVICLSEMQHFGNAARQLGVSQPSLTARLRRIEERVGARLFERSRTKVALTVVGEAVCEAGYDIVAAAERAESSVLDAVEGRRSFLRVGFTQIAARSVLVRILELYKERQPGIELRLMEGATARLEAAVAEHRLDAAFLHPPIHLAGLSEKGLNASRIRRIENARADASRATIQYPKDEAPNAMRYITQADGLLRHPSLGSMADTVLGALVLCSAGYGDAVVPENCVDPMIEQRGLTVRASDAAVLRTSVVWRAMDRRPILGSLVQAATDACARPEPHRLSA